MKTPIRILLLAASLALLSACAQQPTAQAPGPEVAQALQAFPPAEPGYRRHVIVLPPRNDEDQRRVELTGGKVMPVDCNVHGMDGQFNQQDVQGWGYTYWTLESEQQVRSTMMMCPDNRKHDAFVQTESVLIRYNSRLPVVVFVPEGLSLRWRIWEAGTMHDAPVG
ncbi:MAG: ecotin family protein [Ottowia sp.]|nr:ecotin family protein [Ottowia sp.]